MSGREIRRLQAAPLVAAALCLIGLAGRGAGAVGSAQTGAPAPGSPAQLRTVRVVLSSAGPSNSGLYVADGRGYFEQLGIRIEYVRLTYASQTMNLLSTNRVDVADVGMNPALFNGVAAHLGFKVVADKGSQPPGAGYTALVVRKDLAPKIMGPIELKGRTIAVTPPGLPTSTGFALAAYLRRAGLTPADVQIRPIPFPEQAAALVNKSIDAALMSEPFVARVVREGIGVRLVGVDEMAPGLQTAALAYGSQFIREQPDLARAFMVAYVKGIRDYLAAMRRGVDKPAILNILAKAIRLDDMALWETMKPAGFDPDGKVNMASIAQLEQFFLEQRLIAEAPPVNSFVDNSFSQYAAHVLGPASVY